jgi:hypothetical protein
MLCSSDKEPYDIVSSLCLYNCEAVVMIAAVLMALVRFRFHYCRQSPDLPFLHSSLPNIILPQKWQQWRGKTALVHLQTESSTVIPANQRMSPTHVHTPAVGPTPGIYQSPYVLFCCCDCFIILYQL